MFSVAEFRSLEQLPAYRFLWDSLQERTPHASYFQSRGWMECYWRRYADERKFRVLIVTVGEQPVGILPLVIKPIVTNVGTMRVLTYPDDDWAATFAPVGPNPTVTLVGALKHLATSHRDWDLIDLRGVDDAVLDQGRTENALKLAQLSAVHRTWSPSATIDFDALDAGTQFVMRRTLQSAERQLWRTGRWEIEEFATTRQQGLAPDRVLWDSIEPLLVQQTEQEREFLRDVYETAAWDGSLRAQVLHFGGVPSAALLSVASEAGVDVLAAGLLPGAAPELATILTGRMMFDGLTRGDRRFRFGPRVLNLTNDWPVQRTTSGRWTHFASWSPRAQLLRLAQLRHPRTERTAVTTA